jgi:hypothetical protein
MEGTMTATPRLTKSLTQVNTSDAAVPMSGGSATQSDGQIAPLADGGYVVVWTDFSRTHNPAGAAVIGQRYDSAGNKVGGEVKLSAFNSGDQSTPSVTLLDNGNIAVAFRDLFAGDDDIWVRIFNSSLTVVRVDHVDVLANETHHPSITALAGGSYAVSYTFETGADADIVGRIVSPTGTVGAQFDIDNQSDSRDRPELATLSNGNFVAVYEDQVGGSETNEDIRFAIVSPAGTVLTGPITLIGANGPGLETDPDVAALRDGGFVFVWTDADSSVTDIRASLLNSNGAPLVSDFFVNTTTTGAQDEASVVALADGGFLVTWEDDNANLVRAQRFDAAGTKIGTRVHGEEREIRRGQPRGRPADRWGPHRVRAWRHFNRRRRRDDIDLARTRRVARLRWRRQERRSLAPRQRAGLFLGDEWPGGQSGRECGARSSSQ